MKKKTETKKDFLLEIERLKTKLKETEKKLDAAKRDKLIERHVSERKEAENALSKARQELETKVKERTAELRRINKQLKEENRERIRTEQALRLEEARLDALLRLNQISEAPLDEISGFTLEQAIALTQSKIGFVGFLSEDESIYTLHAVSRDVVKECKVASDPMQWHVVDAGIWANAIREHKTLFVNDYSKPHPQKKGLPPGHPYVERFMVVPLTEGQRIVALAGVGNKNSDYEMSDERQIVLLLSGMWNCVQKKRSREELQIANIELEEKVKQRTSELRESEQRLEHAQEVGQIGWWQLDVQRNILTWSDETYRIFGIPKGEPLTYEKFLGFVHPSDRQYVDTQWKAALDGEPYDIEHRIKVGRKVKWVREKAYMEFDDSGKLLGGFGITQDITERKRMENELRRSRDELEIKVKERTAELAKASELLERVFSSVDLAIAYMDKDFNFIRVNRAYADADGREPEFYAGKNHFALFPSKENKKIFRQVVKNGEPYSVYAKPFEYTRHPERGVTYWDWSLQPVKDPSGNVEGIVLSLVDVTERIQAEESVRRNEALLRTVFETLPLGVWLADEEGCITHGNPAGHQIWGGAKYVGIEEFEEYKGWWVETGEPIKPEEWAVARAVRKGETSINEEIEIECFDGLRKIIHNSAVPIRDDKQEIIGAFIINEDITERKRAEKNLRQVQKMEALGTLAGGIAHDFNNILMPITINSEMALFDTPKESVLHEYLQQIADAAKRGKDLVNQIITFSRQKEQKRKPVKISAILEETLKFLRSSLPKNIEIRERIETETDIVLADPTQIHQVLMNLCSNAGYAMRESGGILEIILSSIETDPDMISKHPDLNPGPCVRLTVSDTGAGMSQELMERIFDPFFTTKKPGEGTGMGLAVVHGIVKNHKGVITVYSEPERGSVFHVFLPQIPGEIESETRLSELIPTGKERILVVDDEPVQLQSIKRMLERLGYSVLARAESADALAKFLENPGAFDLVITDQTMPKMTGEKLAESILSIRSDIPVILCTGFSELIDAEKAKAIGVDEFLMKPFSVKEIAETIRRVLERKT
jgi:PAS domain S-box-containing protein